MNVLRTLSALLAALVLAACATKPVALPPRPAPEYAMPAKPDGAFAKIESGIRERHGPEVSGFELLDSNEDGLRWRIALVDSARHSIDLQYYLWYGDPAGLLLIDRVLAAADRGVRVRILIDDLNTLLITAGQVGSRDLAVALVDAHPNIELRLFNPWKNREFLARPGEMVGDLPRLNQRMHNKVMVVDNQATILGGRNIGDEYMGLHHVFNFHDLDVLAIGPVARQASVVFDLYWNSRWAVPVAALGIEAPEAERAPGRVKLAAQLAETKSLARFPLAPKSWSTELGALSSRLHPGKSRVYSDVPTDSEIRHEMLEVMNALTLKATRELLVTNAYIIPAEGTIANLKTLKARGVEMHILTNSLASHDVPAVNSHYKQWRRQILEAGASLHEFRHDPAIQPLVIDTPPTRAEFSGLHSKGMVVDREIVYIGSMNFDPRSAGINSEMGVFVESRGLADALAKLMERDLSPANSWRVEVDAKGELTWTNDRETVTSQPARNFWQRVEDVIFMAFPRDLY
jgi:cardiolipin synthase C